MNSWVFLAKVFDVAVMAGDCDGSLPAVASLRSLAGIVGIKCCSLVVWTARCNALMHNSVDLSVLFGLSTSSLSEILLSRCSGITIHYNSNEL
jgi:hypothetical protein